MEFIDTHSHNYDPAFEGCENEILARCSEAGISCILQADIDSHERERMFELVERHPNMLRPMIGLYPGSVAADWREELDKMIAYRGRGEVAVGEIGLDYHFSTEWKSEQREAFRTQLELASLWDLPVNIHLRDATEDFFEIIEDCRHLHLRGNLHAFSASAEVFERVGRSGDWYVGIGGVLTFKKASIAQDILRIPLERIVLETDAPYLAPTPHRGERNDSSFLPLIAAFLAERKGVSIEDVASVTTANAKRLFAL